LEASIAESYKQKRSCQICASHLLKHLVHESYERENKRKRSTEATVFIPLAFDRLTVEENTKILLEHIKMFRGKGVGPAVTAFGVV
jgi:hypothetical protein